MTFVLIIRFRFCVLVYVSFGYPRPPAYFLMLSVLSLLSVGVPQHQQVSCCVLWRYVETFCFERCFINWGKLLPQLICMYIWIWVCFFIKRSF